MRGRRRIRRSGALLHVDLEDQERELLGSLMGQLRELITEPTDSDDRLRRLFPTAYPDDPKLDAEYHKYMREELVTSHTMAIDRVASSLSATTLSEAEAMSWLQSLNSVRLVLGTMLDIAEDMDIGDVDQGDPAYGSYALYGYLSGLLDEIVEQLS